MESWDLNLKNYNIIRKTWEFLSSFVIYFFPTPLKDSEAWTVKNAECLVDKQFQPFKLSHLILMSDGTVYYLLDFYKWLPWTGSGMPQGRTDPFLTTLLTYPSFNLSFLINSVKRILLRSSSTTQRLIIPFFGDKGIWNVLGNDEMSGEE